MVADNHFCLEMCQPAVSPYRRILSMDIHSCHIRFVVPLDYAKKFPAILCFLIKISFLNSSKLISDNFLLISFSTDIPVSIIPVSSSIYKLNSHFL